MRFQFILTLLALLVYGKLATSFPGRFNCKQDILLILDTSLSIGERNFNKNVKEFLKLLVNKSRLNISTAGTHLAIMVFSSEQKTEIILPFSDKYDKKYLTKEIDNLDWDTLKGGHTRTDLALRLANQVFQNNSPQNLRPMANDVIIMITDGHPQGVYNAKSEAVKEATKLKDKHVLIIGVAVGDAVEKRTYMEILQKLSSPGQTLEAEFGNINIILDALVDKSCRSSPALDCSCPPSILGDLKLAPGLSSIKVNWKIPQPECASKLESVTPNVIPGDAFPAGHHIIIYSYKNENNSLLCNVSFEVKEFTMCRGQPFTDTTHICCCGALRKKLPGYKCCGMDYYSTLIKKCCPMFNIKTKEQSCAGPACTCSTVSLGTTYIAPGISSVPVKWTIPKPNCRSTLKNISSEVKPGQAFSVGVYNIKYSYKVFDNFEATCEVHFEVKECSCRSITLSPQKVPAGRTMKIVNWTPPRPTCREARLMSGPPKRAGEYFPIGHHQLHYVYNVKRQFNMTCGVSFEIRGALCRDKGYNVANQTCCCGIIHDKRPGYACCGQDFYPTLSQKCCHNIGARNKAVPCPRQ